MGIKGTEAITSEVIEACRSQPSREMVIRLSEALEIPLRERNVLLQSAGYAAIYRESALDEPSMAPIHNALRGVLEHHEPLPALVVDRMWDVQMHNHAAEIDPMQPVDGSLMPVLPLELNIDGFQLSLFSVISTFGTPQDVTTDELRIEAFYPADAATQAFFAQAQPTT